MNDIKYSQSFRIGAGNKNDPLNTTLPTQAGVDATFIIMKQTSIHVLPTGKDNIDFICAM